MSAPKKNAPPAPEPAGLTYWENILASLEENNRLLREIVEVERAKNAKGKGMKS